ncbi:MAG: hypothetical protein SFY95_06580 [Planctomycetota bacterium]|nr:hypothetical protein [Planctomycetota bacterium]
MKVLLASLFVAAAAGTVSAQAFFESGAAGTFSTADWATDRYAPAGWTGGATDPLGGASLRISVSNADRRDLRPGAFNSAFYDTQGRQRASAIAGTWEVGGEIFIPASWLQPGTLRRSDLWARDNNPDEGSSRYLIAGFINNDPADGFNPLAGGFSPRFRVWNSTVGWTNLSVAVRTDQYNSLRIVNTGTSHEYYINGALVASNSGASYSQIGFSDLRTTWVQAFNFGNASNAASLPDSGYDVHWRNVYAIPAPGAMGLLGVMGLAAARRRR